MDATSIAAIATSLSQQSVQGQAAVAVGRRALDQQKLLGAEVIRLIDGASARPRLPGESGQIVDIAA